MPTPRKPLMVFISTVLHGRLKRAAARDGKKMWQLVEAALEQHLRAGKAATKETPNETDSSK